MNFARNAFVNFKDTFRKFLESIKEDTCYADEISQEEIDELAKLLPELPDVVLVWSTS